MNKGIYTRLAVTNIKKNKSIYLPYIGTCIACIAMFYMVLFLMYNKGMEYMPGPDDVRLILKMGVVVIAIFSFIFLLYSNCFLMKRRQKEIGLYNILGMEKAHISKVLFRETLFTALWSMAAGIVLGILGSKLALLLLLKLLHIPAQFGFSVSGKAIACCAAVYTGIFLVILLNNLRRVHVSRPIELLQGSHTGEREPKAKWLMALIGFGCLGTGYYLAIETKSPLEAIPIFFVAVVLVMAGTYLVFTAGSIVILKMLRWKKSFYYKVQNFTSVSGMLYRMKQNAVGLASICILSTGVLLMLSTTTSLNFGMQDVMKTRYPYEVNLSARNVSLDEGRKIQKVVLEEMEKQKIPTDRLDSEIKLSINCIKKGTKISFQYPENLLETSFDTLVVIPQDQILRKTDQMEPLQDGEILVYSEDGDKGDVLQIQDQKYKVKEWLKEWPLETSADPYFYLTVTGVVVTDADFGTILEQQAEAYGNVKGNLAAEINADFPGEKETEIAYANQVAEMFDKAMETEAASQDAWSIQEIREEKYQTFYNMNGGLLFLGIFLGILFLMGTAMIIYYKQMSEGYEDRGRFAIMRKVGMSRKEVKASIRKQILMVFFLPLLAAILHIVMAFPLVKRLLMVMSLTNTKLFVTCTAGTVMVFTIVYGLIYFLTAKSYYQILDQANE